MSEDITTSMINKPAKKRTLLIVGSFFAVLLITVLVLAGMAYALLTSGARQTYHSPGSAGSDASGVTLMMPRGASDTIPAIGQGTLPDSASAPGTVEQLDPTQAIPATAASSPDLPGKPLDPTNRGVPQDNLDNLF